MNKKLINLTAAQWEKFLTAAADREQNDDHLTTAEREALLTEWKRRNPSELGMLTGELHEDFVRVVFQ